MLVRPSSISSSVAIEPINDFDLDVARRKIFTNSYGISLSDLRCAISFYSSNI